MEAGAPFRYHSSGPPPSEPYVTPAVMELLRDVMPPGARVLDAGCGNGSLARFLLAAGYDVTGVDLSPDGIAIARATYPGSRFEVLPADEHVLDGLGCEPFDAVVSTEVIEHLFEPQQLATGAYRALRPGGRFVCSTPYNGWLKNVLLAASGSFDTHVHPLTIGGHIKFFSRGTLGELLTETGFTHIQFRGTGRLPLVWKSMVMSGDRAR